MRDYGLKLFAGIRDTTNVQQDALQSLLFPDVPIKPDQSLVLGDMEHDSYERPAKKTPIQIGLHGNEKIRKILLYNSLARPQEHLVQLRVNTSNVKVKDSDGKIVIIN